MLRPIEEPGPARKPDRTDGENDDGGEGHQTGSGPPLETALCVEARTLGFLLMRRRWRPATRNSRCRSLI